jgi:type I restriction enzyme M protein
MPTKRQILETLKLTELQDLASTFELFVGDRRVRDQLIDAAGISHRVSLAQILGEYPRERLKEICRELGLDDHGKEKAAIVARILGREPEQGSLKLSVSEPTRPPSEKPRGFEAKLWQAADKLRNNMDAAEYKHVVLGLIFLKYISDTSRSCTRQAFGR